MEGDLQDVCWQKYSKDMKDDIKYLELLSRSFPTIQSACTEITNLEAILNLPKGTEHFLTDLHGEYDAFQHILKNASGVIKIKVEEVFGHTIREQEKRELCALIYYPESKLKQVKEREGEFINDWYTITLVQIVKILEAVSSKYTRSKVRKALPAEYSYIIQELLHESSSQPDKQKYINAILDSIIETGSADPFIIAVSKVIHRLTIDSLHIIGDIYDRGPAAHLIMDTICEYHNCDIQWGNHDLVWMGAAAGSAACIANALRISLRYANLEAIEEGYGINLLPLARFAMDTYGNDPCKYFKPKIGDNPNISPKEEALIARMHKAITIIQFKLESEIINAHEEFGMSSRNLLHMIDFKRGTVELDGVDYPLKDTYFPTIDPTSPYKLSDEELDVVKKLVTSFKGNEKLRKHINCLYSKGSLYLVRNGNLLYHGSMLMNEDGTFKSVRILGEEYSGKALFDKIDTIVREGFYEKDPVKKKFGEDFIWFLWCGPYSPPFDKDKMATFERYFIADKATHKEKKGAYSTLKNRKDICEKILEEFGVTGQYTHIINGHIPVKTTQGETPIKADGKLLVIDGGFSKAYQEETGIAGYTLIFNSHGLKLVQHHPFESAESAALLGKDIISTTSVVDFVSNRMLVKDTDNGKRLRAQVDDLKKLLEAYRSGKVRQRG